MKTTTLENARVVAQPVAVQTADGALVWEMAPQLKRTPEEAEDKIRPKGEARRLVGRTYLATADGFSYYHWLFGTLPRLLVARRLGLEFDHYLVNPRHKGDVNFQTETLALLGIPLEKVIWMERGTHLECQSLTGSDEPCTHEQTRLTDWARDLLRETFLPLAAGLPGASLPAKRFIVSRADARRRRLVDEAELGAALAEFGFETVALGAMPFLEQVRLFAGADVVVGLHGAGLANLVFAAPGAQVFEFRPTVWDHPCFENLADRCSLAYSAQRVEPVGEREGFQADAELGELRLEIPVHA